MDIHPPEGPTHSLKDFGIHILVVTIGILIALGLEGIRESWREHGAVVEARSSFQDELSADRKQLDSDLIAVREVNAQLDQLLAVIPQLSKSPDVLEKRVRALKPAFYFFRTTAWESAITSGKLSHMEVQELNRYIYAYLSVKNYQDASRAAIPEYIGVEAYFQSYHSFSPDAQAEGERRLRTLKMEFEGLEHLGKEFASDVDAAVSSDKSRSVP